MKMPFKGMEKKEITSKEKQEYINKDLDKWLNHLWSLRGL